jgi:hypothetical protein
LGTAGQHAKTHCSGKSLVWDTDRDQGCLPEISYSLWLLCVAINTNQTFKTFINHKLFQKVNTVFYTCSLNHYTLAISRAASSCHFKKGLLASQATVEQDVTSSSAINLLSPRAYLSGLNRWTSLGARGSVYRAQHNVSTCYLQCLCCHCCGVRTSDGSYRFTLGNEFTESRSQEGIIIIIIIINCNWVGIIQRNHSLSRYDGNG